MLAEQQSFDADVFVEVGPMYSIAGPTDLKISPFGWCAVRETGIPTDRNGYRPAVLVDQSTACRP